MACKIKTKVDLTGDLKTASKAMDGAALNVGVLTGEHKWLAGIHEY